MSRRRGAASKTAPQPEKETLIRALKLCSNMSVAEWDFIEAIPETAFIPVPDERGLTQRGLVTRVGEWVAITQEGLRQLGAQMSRSWLLALARVPGREVLIRLVEDGIIENVYGFPALTSFGGIVQAQIVEGRKYTASHAGQVTELGNDLSDDEGRY